MAMNMNKEDVDETGPLLPQTNGQTLPPRSYLKTILYGTVGVAALVLFSFRTGELVEAGELVSSPFSFTVDSGYGQPQTIQNGFYDGISAIAEPHRIATLTLSNSKEERKTFKWTIIEELMDKSDKYFDSESFAQQSDRSKIEPKEPKFDMDGAILYKSSENFITHKFGAIAGKRIHISLKCEETGETVSMTVHGKYIRRELRSLNDEDREVYLSALHKVYTHSSVILCVSLPQPLFVSI